jgi:flagellar hook-length control protein FliK
LSEEVTVPSVASEVQNSVPVRHHLHGARNTADGKQPSSPFAELLDSAAPADTPAPRPQRQDRSEPSDPSASAKSADGNAKDASAPIVKGKPGKDAGNIQKVASTGDAGDAQPATDGVTASAATNPTVDLDPVAAAPSKDKADTTDTPKADAKPKSDSADAGAIEQAVPDVAPAATTQVQAPVDPQLNPQPAAPAPHAEAEGDGDVEPPPALQAAAPQVGEKPEQGRDGRTPAAAKAADGSPTPVQNADTTPAPAQNTDGTPLPAQDADGKLTPKQVADSKPSPRWVPGTRPSLSYAKDAAPIAPTDPTVDPADDAGTAPQIADGAKQQPAKGEAVPVEARHSFAELFSKVDADAPQQRAGTSDSAGVPIGTDGAVPAGATAASASPGNVASAAPTSTSPALAPQPVAVPLAGLAFEIATQASNGKNHFEIRLDPPELGRIDVKLNVDRDGNVSTHLVADRSDTLDLLKRDSASLERALQDSGLKTSDNGLQFSLRQQDSGSDETPAQNTTQLIIPEDDAAPLEALRQGYGRLLGLGGGLDIRV